MSTTLERRLKLFECEAWQYMARRAPNVALRKAYHWKSMKLMLELNLVRIPHDFFGGQIEPQLHVGIPF